MFEGIRHYCGCGCLLLIIANLFTYFKFWGGVYNFIPYMWQVVFANVFIQGRVVHSCVYCFFYGTSHIVPIPAYTFEAVH